MFLFNAPRNIPSIIICKASTQMLAATWHPELTIRSGGTDHMAGEQNLRGMCRVCVLTRRGGVG